MNFNRKEYGYFLGHVLLIEPHQMPVGRISEHFSDIFPLVVSDTRDEKVLTSCFTPYDAAEPNYINIWQLRLMFGSSPVSESD